MLFRSRGDFGAVEDAEMEENYREYVNDLKQAAREKTTGPSKYDLEEAMEKMLWFYSCGKEETSKSKTKKKVISFEHDFDYINAGFMQDYKIDLFEVDFLHWWKFMSLFSALHDDCKICEIIGYRSAELKNFDKEQRKRIREMQKIYALPDEISKEEKKRQDEITQILLNGGDLSGIL